MARLRFETDLGTTLKAHADLAKATEKIAAGYSRGTAEAKKLELAAKRIVDANLTPQERYNQKIEQLGKALRAGAVGFNDAQNAAGRLRQRLDAVGQTQQSVFGASALANIKNYFATMAGPGALIGGAIAALRNYNAELDKLNQEFRGGIPRMGQLAQLAVQEKDPKAAIARYMREAELFVTSGAVPDLPSGTDLMFSLLSAGVTSKDDREKIAELLKYGGIESGTKMAQSLAAMKLAFPQVSPRQMLAMGVVAATPSPGTAGELVEHAGKLSAQFEAMGWTPGQALAATSIVGAAYGGASFGRERSEAMAKNLEHFGFQKDPALRGMGIFQMLEHIGAGGTSQEHLRPLLGGRQEATQAFRTLYKNRELFKGLATAADQGDIGMLDNMLELLKGVPQIAVTAEQNAAAGRRAVSRTEPATTVGLLKAIRDEQVEGRGALVTGANDLVTWLGTFLPESLQQRALRNMAEDYPERLTPDLLDQIRRHIESLDNKTAPSLQPAKISGRQE